MSDTDTQAASNGRPFDWAAELARHGRWLRTVIFARLGDREWTEDVFQEVSLAAVEQKAPLADPAKAAPWLYQLAVNQSLAYRRKRGRERERVDRYGRRRTEEETGSGGDPLDWLLADERRQLVREALVRLSDDDREILLLKYTEDWTYDDLARHLGATRSAIESRLHRSRERLRRELALVNITSREP